MSSPADEPAEEVAEDSAEPAGPVPTPALTPASIATVVPLRAPTAPARQSSPAPLWREAVGRELREERQRAGRTLADVAGAAGVSLPYLSEVERGRKEPSSEVLEAVGGALGLELVDLTARVTRSLVRERAMRSPVCLAA